MSTTEDTPATAVAGRAERGVRRHARTLVVLTLRLVLLAPLLLIAAVLEALSKATESLADGAFLAARSLKQVTEAPFAADLRRMAEEAEAADRAELLRAMHGELDA